MSIKALSVPEENNFNPTSGLHPGRLHNRRMRCSEKGVGITHKQHRCCGGKLHHAPSFLNYVRIEQNTEKKTLFEELRETSREKIESESD